MNRKKRITYYKLVFKVKHRLKKKKFHHSAAFNKTTLRLAFANLTNQAQTFGSFGDLFSLSQTSWGSSASLRGRVASSDMGTFVHRKDEILYDRNFSYRGMDRTFKINEVRIPRIRFKPGYQRLWREARTALKDSMNLRFIYQQQLTKYLTTFYRRAGSYAFARSEMSLDKMIMYSRLLPDKPTIDTFVAKGSVFVNGRPVTDLGGILVPNDFIQLVVSVWHYAACRWIANWTLKRHNKFKKLVYRKGLAGRYKVMKQKKQRSYYTPNWVTLARYDISDIKPFLEVDYLTLSAFVLYEPFLTYHYAPDDSADYRLNIYRMYNWKYIT